jgi:hypothetical protein
MPIFQSQGKFLLVQSNRLVLLLIVFVILISISPFASLLTHASASDLSIFEMFSQFIMKNTLGFANYYYIIPLFLYLLYKSFTFLKKSFSMKETVYTCVLLTLLIFFSVGSLLGSQVSTGAENIYAQSILDL